MLFVCAYLPGSTGNAATDSAPIVLDVRMVAIFNATLHRDDDGPTVANHARGFIGEDCVQ